MSDFEQQDDPPIEALGAMIGMMSAKIILECSRDPQERAEAQCTLERSQRVLNACNDTATATATTASTA